MTASHVHLRAADIADQTAEPALNRDFNKTDDAAHASGYTAAGVERSPGGDPDVSMPGNIGREMNELRRSWECPVGSTRGIPESAGQGGDSSAGRRERKSKWGARQGGMRHEAVMTSVTPSVANRNAADV